MPAPRRLVVLGVLAFGAASPTFAQTSGVLRACVQKGSLQTRIVSDSDTCKSTETLVTWNLQGPKGDKGDKGDTGPQGDPGPKGDPGAGLDTGVVIGRLLGCVGTVQAGQNKAPFSLIGEGVSGITDTEGRFRIQWLSPGGHDLFAGGPQFHFEVTSGQTFDVGDLLTTNLDTNPFNCGVCGHACAPTEACSAGVCVANTTCSGHGTLVGAVCVCSAGWVGPNCESPATTSCTGHGTLMDGLCVCQPGWMGVVCELPSPTACSGNGTLNNGICTCNIGWTGANCETPTSTCVPGQAMCNGICVDTQTNSLNCGVCGNVCTTPNGASTCVAGQCQLQQCVPGYANCDQMLANGCEVNTNADVQNCGACGRVCAAGQACVNGQCSGGTGSAIEAAASPLERLLSAARLRHN